MYTNWEIVEYASTFLMSSWAQAIVAAKSAVSTPIQAMIVPTSLEATEMIGLTRHMRYTPAVTMVAAWISAETGVGPSMASGSQMYNGSWADLPTAPRNSSSAIAVAVPMRPMPCENTVL